MSNTHSIKVFGAPRVASPRGARIGADFVATTWLTLKAMFPPAPRRAPTRTEEATAVREIALRVRATDPGFASDLMAAADRHEIDDA